MNEAAYALLGVGLGAVIPAVANLYSTRVDSRRAAEDRQDARNARLFDHRREAYSAFIKEARGMLDWLWHVDAGFSDAPEPDYDAFDALLAREADVLMYGTTATSTQARNTFDALSAYNRSGDDSGTYDGVEQAIRAFIEAARADLGVSLD